jgi:hypothetical protein
MAVQPTHKRLSNGLQSLSEASPDYELAPVGIASMHDQAQRLAEYGRNGDVYVIHAAEGETVIPMEVLDANPQIKQLLFAQMKDMGLDPQEFVVGNELNSINPVTGLPEFFFKSIFRAVKKAVKGVFKFAKKIAPIALPVAASLFFPGYPVLAGAIGGGLGSLAGGGSLKDAFKNAMISGGTAALWGGVKGLQSIKGADPIGFMEGVKQSVAGGIPGAPTMADQWGRLTEGTLGGIEDFLYAAPTSEKTSAVGGPYADLAKKAGYKPEEILWHSKDDLAGTSLDTLRDYTPFAEPKLDEFRGAEALNIAKERAYNAEVIDYAKRIGKSVLDIPDIEKYQIGTAAADKVTAASLTSGPLKQWGPLGLASLGVGGASGMFKSPEEDELTTADLEFGLAGGVLEPNKLFAAEETAGTGAGGRNKFLIPVNPREFEENILKGPDVFQPSRFAFAADGGMINGPGTGTSDSIPGWLSDGEFVFTEKAVRGADPTGQGRRQAGANNMYNIMRNFEMSA